MALPSAGWERPAGIPHLAPRRLGRLWVAVAAASICLLTVPPIAIAAWRTPAGSLFSGYVVIARDALVYQAIERAGWQGAWLFHSPYTGETLPGVVLYGWYLWPAHLLGWAAGPWLYHAARLAAAAALLTAVFQLVRQLFQSRLLRRWAFILCALGGGIGILLPEVRVGPLVTRATEMASPGSSVADLIEMAPHLPWAGALMCWAMLAGLRLRRQLDRRWMIGGLAAIVGLQLIYPQLAVLTTGALMIWSWRRGHAPASRYALLAAVVQLPYLAYLALVWRTTPAALSVIRPSLDVGDVFGFVVLSHLVASLLIAVALWRRRLRADLLLPALWIAGMTLFMFTPGLHSVVGRSFMASSIPFGLCATPGLLAVLRGIRRAPWRRRVLALTLSASSLYGVFSLAQPYWIATFRLDPRAEYESRAEATLLQRLAPHTSSRDLVLSTYLDGIFVPAQTSARVFAGHPEMTIAAAEKSTQALAFFTSWGAARRDAFLRANHIDYVLVTDAGTVGRLAQDPCLSLIDLEAGGALFLVTP
jgi:hypothetical protein